MDEWLIEPRDPLLAGDGRPAGLFGGRLSTVGFPYPSMLAGAVRTRLAAGGGSFRLAGIELEELRRIAVHGPLLAELEAAQPTSPATVTRRAPGTADASDAVHAGDAKDAAAGAETEDADVTVAQWLAPAPRDAMLIRDDAGIPGLVHLLPHLTRRSARSGPSPAVVATTDSSGASRPNGADDLLCDSLSDRGLVPVHPSRGRAADKPLHGAPAFWRWQIFEHWLIAPRNVSLPDPAALGLAALPVERRGHVAIQPGTRVGLDGMLFETAGLRFLAPAVPAAGPLAPRRFALSVRCAGGTVSGRRLQLAAQMAPLGGERRLARWRPSRTAWPALPAGLATRIVAAGRARLVLLSPAAFAGGALPGWSGRPSPWAPAVTATVRAACVPRPEIVSGWDLAAGNGPGQAKGRPKPTRRLAAAGSVYFLDLSGSEAEIVRWCAGVWLACVSDAAQDARDGFGLAALGTWEED